jgi:hypothetical protein
LSISSYRGSQNLRRFGGTQDVEDLSSITPYIYRVRAES